MATNSVPKAMEALSISKTKELKGVCEPHLSFTLLGTYSDNFPARPKKETP